MGAFTTDSGSSSLDATIKKLSDDCQSNYKLRLIGKRDNDSQQYNDPSSNDIGGLIVGDIGNFHFERDIIIEQCYGSLEKISKLHPKFMALQYPLLFPYGDDGYRCNIMFVNQDHQLQRKCSRVPMRAFYAYLIHERANIENIVIKGGRLYQQFLVDAFVNVEKDRLDYIRANQSIHEAILRGDVEGNAAGKIIVLSSLTGSPRYMINNYQDIQRDIRKNIPYKQEDKSDIVTRVFQAKVVDMIAYIKSGKPFGRTIVEDVDSIVSAEIPCKITDPICYNIVSKFMIHGPYGLPNQKSKCMNKGQVLQVFSKTISSNNDF
uniref:Helitron helicase-like domain-containing protein n=1 Tax=Salix viminalis TaxID=40686 RepID=A0A6N2K990_SALVM